MVCVFSKCELGTPLVLYTRQSLAVSGLLCLCNCSREAPCCNGSSRRGSRDLWDGIESYPPRPSPPPPLQLTTRPLFLVYLKQYLKISNFLSFLPSRILTSQWFSVRKASVKFINLQTIVEGGPWDIFVISKIRHFLFLTKHPVQPVKKIRLRNWMIFTVCHVLERFRNFSSYGKFPSNVKTRGSVSFFLMTVYIYYFPVAKSMLRYC